MAFRWIGKSKDGNTVTLKRLEGCPIVKPLYYSDSYASSIWLKTNPDQVRIGAVLDIETTGLNQNEDLIIEIAIKQFLFNRISGEILDVRKSYTSFQDPGMPLPPKIIEITGITNEMVVDKHIDWSQVDIILDECSLMIAHNARFDRSFIDKKSKISKDKIWACTYKHIDWNNKGYNSSKLELLNIYHGFFTDSHRAMNDVDALLYLLSLKDENSNSPYLLEMLNNARRPMTQIIASSAPFESKDRLKERGYNWDAIHRFWSKIIFKDEMADEIQWLEADVYQGLFGGLTRDISLSDNFKN